MSMKVFDHEAERIRKAYAHRDASGKDALYVWSRPEVLLSHYRFRVAVTQALAKIGWSDWANKDCLDVGCGYGGWLRTIQEWGGKAPRLHGTDILPDRIARARELSPNLDFFVSDSWPMPLQDKSMDFISAHMVFSSILNKTAREKLAFEMQRVLRDDGVILIYEFRISDPRNPDTIGIGKKEMSRLFPQHELRMQTVTLAPPIFRRLAKWSPLIAHMTEVLLPFLRTHAVFTLKQSKQKK